MLARQFIGSTRILSVVASLCAAPCVLAQSDNCAGATLVAEGSFSGSTAAASNDGSPTCGESASTADVWYRYVADRACRLALDTCGSSYDTVLSIHSACPGTAANELACNDDTCAFGSRVAVDTVVGQTYFIRVSGWNGAVGDYQLHVACQEPGPPGADAYMGELSDLRAFGRVGNVIGCAIDTPVCNAGTDPLDWFGFPDARHPMAVFNAYRIEAGRIEQIGQSWAKHGIGAAQENGCGFGCTPNGNSTRLGVGCSDTYSASFNAERFLLGPRSEINPWSGAFVYAGSYLEQHGGDTFDGVQHRLRLHDADLTASLHPGAVYVCEAYAVAHDDVNHMNSVAWEHFAPTRPVGGEWVLDISAGGAVNGPAIHAWAGSSRVTVPATPIDDGRCILAWMTTDLGNGAWHYEYALYNLDMQRAVGSFRIPVASGVALTNIGFHAVETEEPGYSNAPWIAQRDATGLVWATETFEQNPRANSLRWGTLYNFWFDADAAPTTAGSAAVLGLFLPGAPAALAADGVAVPSGAAPCPGDLDGDRDVDIQDLATLLAHFGQASGATFADGDLDADGDVDLADLAALLSVFGAVCA